MLKVLFNGDPGSVKRYKTLNYEGDQARVTGDANNEYMLHDDIGGTYDTFEKYIDNWFKPGWYVKNLFTDIQKGTLKEFLDKENKWYNYIRGYQDANAGDELDSGEFSAQGLGVGDLEEFTGTISATVYGCKDPTACNYNPSATIDDGSCELPDGCTDPLADNYNSNALCDDGSCTYSSTCSCSGFSGANFTMSYNWTNYTSWQPLSELVNFNGLSPCNTVRIRYNGVDIPGSPFINWAAQAGAYGAFNVPEPTAAEFAAAPNNQIVVMVQVTDNCNNTYLALASIWPAEGSSVSNSGVSS
jgi:hypothetical protein